MEPREGSNTSFGWHFCADAVADAGADAGVDADAQGTNIYHQRSGEEAEEALGGLLRQVWTPYKHK